MKKKYYTWDNVEQAAHKIVLQMYNDNWRPDYIVGVTRGGLALALVLSHMLKCRMETLKVKLRDGNPDESCETNCWMSEDAFGYVDQENRTAEYQKSEVYNKKNILVVDDINDTGATFNWIKNDWQTSCLPNDPNWDTVWGGNVRFAVMTENLASDFGLVQYCWDEVDKSEENVWLVYPWEYN
jgi:hypoxanthine phosphoribosyltransferase